MTRLNESPRETRELRNSYSNIPEALAGFRNTFRALGDILAKVIEVPTERLYIGMTAVILSGDAERRTVGDDYLLTAGGLIAVRHPFS